jgi:stage II sporulation protein AB (anti-sigma F factor)
MDKLVNNSIKLEFPSKGENVALARITIAALVSQLELTLNDLEEIKVAVSEAVSNAVIHGYGNKPDGLITVIGILQNEKIIIEIIDQGIGINDIEKAMEPAFSTDPERTGLGFVFMQSFMDEVKVESQENHGTRVILSKQLNSENKKFAVS